MSTPTSEEAVEASDGSSDEDARSAIREDLDRTHFVEAGAGTGKTTELIARIVALITSDRARIDEIAAITFTEPAAAELRDRLRDALERVVGSNAHLDGRSITEVDETGCPERGDADIGPVERRDRVLRALSEIDSAAIGTLHGFARRLLAEHLLEAGLPPQIEVLDEVESSVAFDERWSELVDSLLSGTETSRVLSLALLRGVRLDHLRELAMRCNDNWDLVSDFPWPPGHVDTVDVSGILTSIAQAWALAGHCTFAGDGLLGRLEQFQEWAHDLEESSSEIETVKLLNAMPSGSVSRVGQRGNWGGAIDEVRSLLQSAAQACKSLVDRVALQSLGSLLAVIGDWTLAAATDRRRNGRLAYHDLLVQARDLLRRRPDVVAEVAKRYRYLLIDEFQDTDPIQAELAVRIASCAIGPQGAQGSVGEPGSTAPDGSAVSGQGTAGGGAEWRGLRVHPGRLFFVGDPKQAIYRFRRADIALYTDLQQRYTDCPLQLTRNHRSAPGIIDWVNAVCGKLIGDGDPPVQPSYRPLERFCAAQPDIEIAPPVVVIGGAGEGSESADAIRRREGHEIAAAVRRVVDEGWLVSDAHRAARWSDIAILVPTRTGLRHLLPCFEEAGIRFRLETSSLVYTSELVRDLISILRAVNDPNDGIAVVSALRAASFACGDDDLLEHRMSGGSWDYRMPTPSALGDGHAVARGMRVLDELHRCHRWLDVSQLVTEVVVRCRMFELALAEARPRELWRSLRITMDDARTFSDAFGGDLGRYLTWVDQQAGDRARSSEAVLPETDDDAVRIMTVHAAKGLEFPVVVMAGLGVAVRAPSRAQILWGPDGPEVRVPTVVSSPGWADLQDVESKMEAAERRRLLYVAATRAKDHLIVSLHRRPNADCPALWIEDAAAEFPELWRRDVPGALESKGSPALTNGMGEQGSDRRTDDLEEQADLVSREAWQAQREALLARGRVPRVIAATSVAKLITRAAGAGGGAGAGDSGRADAGFEDEGPTGGQTERPAWRRGRAGTALGRAVHGVLQVIDLGSGDGLEVLARAQAVAEGVPERSNEVSRLVRAALDSDVVAQAVACGRFWRELYVGVPFGDRVLEGIIDLLVDGPTGLHVVDYKTDQYARSDEIEHHAAAYRFQGAAYAAAIESALGRPVAKCTLLFLRADGAVGVEVANLAKVVAQVREAVAGFEVTADLG
ncbi:MAG: UvrD-helicase domain-containing protein [Actinomycetota bacterium]|nr:UvrD-helicase domain-containing protein [Actinomycetota bacterium]